jgi:hypothetical protein
MKLSDRLKALKEEFSKMATTALAELFVDHPEVACVHWKQYTPSYNDGDPCTFTLRGPSVWQSKEPMTEAVLERLLAIAGEDPDAFDEDTDESESADAVFVSEHLQLLRNNASKEIQCLFSTLEEEKNVLEAAYGEYGAEVVLFKGRAVVSDYYCD